MRLHYGIVVLTIWISSYFCPCCWFVCYYILQCDILMSALGGSGSSDVKGAGGGGEGVPWPTGADGYKLDKMIGKGAFATVWKAFCATRGVHVAVKVMDLENVTHSFEDIRQEVGGGGMFPGLFVVDSTLCSVRFVSHVVVALPVTNWCTSFHLVVRRRGWAKRKTSLLVSSWTNGQYMLNSPVRWVKFLVVMHFNMYLCLFYVHVSCTARSLIRFTSRQGGCVSLRYQLRILRGPGKFTCLSVDASLGISLRVGVCALAILVHKVTIVKLLSHLVEIHPALLFGMNSIPGIFWGWGRFYMCCLGVNIKDFWKGVSTRDISRRTETTRYRRIWSIKIF